MRLTTGFDHLERHARQTPERIAITGPGGQIDWRRFQADAAHFAHALGKLGVGPGRIAVIPHPDPYTHWLLIIACESLGAVSASLAPGDMEGGPLLEMADLVLTEERVAGLPAKSGATADSHRRHPTDPDTPMRIIRTSGSTGIPKCMMIHRQAQSHRIAAIAPRNSLSAASRLYLAYPFSVNLIYYRAEACLRVGGTVIFGRASQDLLTYDATHCWLLPRDMERLLQGVRGTWPSPHPLHMSLGGGPVSAALHDQTASALGTKVSLQYGTNETGIVGLLDRDGIGTVDPEVDLKVVDEGGQPLPEGEPGRFVLRSPEMVTGYLNEPEASAEHFRDGWFYSDDLGVRFPDGRFRIVGRRSDIINLGGIKISPYPIEEKLRANVPGIQEVVVTSILGPLGIEEVCLAVVPAPTADRSAIVAAIGRETDVSVGQVWLRLFDKLPVGPSGKVQRAALKEIFAAGRSRGDA